ncbi:MAG: hypothetical protein ABIV06_06830 [Thermoanaerobaculia bacterium]
MVIWRRQLRAALQAIAQPASIQNTLFPEFVEPAPELVEDLEDALHAMKFAATPEELEVEMKAVQTIVDLLSSFPNIDETFWSRSALSTDSRWEDARALSRQVLQALGWESDPPSESFATYVRG